MSIFWKIWIHIFHILRVNFDIIHHQCRGTPLQNPIEYYETIHNKDFSNRKVCVGDNALSSAIKSERNSVRVESNLVESHIKSPFDVKKNLELNGFFVKTRKQRKTTGEYKI